jgi:glycine cleavage system T protein (aminomethyltransferase)
MNSTPKTDPALHQLFQGWGADFYCEAGVNLPLRVEGAGAEYEAALNGVILADGGDRSWVRMEGADLLDFLQRILSSDVMTLKAGSGQWSAMLDGKGHWIADLLLYRLPDINGVPQIWIDCPTCRIDAVVFQLDKYHFGEDLSWDAGVATKLLVGGPGAGKLLTDEALLLGESDFSVELTSGCLLAQRPDRGLACWELSGPTGLVVDLAQRFQNSGACPSGLVVLDILRVEAWIPRWGQDFDQGSTLPETGEWHRASLTKGCYAGQEVVAKINTYGQAPRQLCQLGFESGRRSLVGSELRNADGGKLGVVTSWVWSPRLDRPIGLGVVRRRALTSQEPLFTHFEQEVFTTTVQAPAKVVS